MRKLFLLLTLFVFTSLTWSCSDDYDDSAIWEELNILKNRIAQMNSEISSLQTIINALNSGKSIKSVSDLTEGNGYRLTFSDDTYVDIHHGSEGAAGSNAPVIGIEEVAGIYYWTLNGIIIESSDGPLPVTGEAPQVGINSEGFWTVNGNIVTDGSGTPVKAAGENGDSIFADIEQTDTSVILTLSDGTVITLPKLETVVFEIEGSDEKVDFAYGQTLDFKLTISGMESYSFSKPDGWKVIIEENILTVTAPVQDNTFAEISGAISIVAIGNTTTCIAKLHVEIVAPAVLYSADGQDWTEVLPGSFSKLAVRSVGGAVVTKEILDYIHNSAVSYALDLSQADYESTVFRSYNVMGYGSDSKLTSISLPRNIEEIANEAGFQNNIALSSVVFPTGIKKIGWNCFAGTTSLKKVEFPEGTEVLGKMMFYYFGMMGYGEFGGEPAIEEIVIPSTVTDWGIGTTGTYFFYGCSNLKRIICRVAAPPYMNSVMNGWSDFESVPSDCIIYVPDGSVQDYKEESYWSNYDIRPLSEIEIE